jgi:hypothetical protein
MLSGFGAFVQKFSKKVGSTIKMRFDARTQPKVKFMVLIFR